MSRAKFLSEPDRELIDWADGSVFCGYDDGQGWTSWFTETGEFIGVTQTPKSEQQDEKIQEV